MPAERIPQATAKTVVFKAFLASDHLTPATGKTIDITLSKNTGAFGDPDAGATTATEIALGWYFVAIDTVDTDTLGPLIVHGDEASIDPVDVEYTVVVPETAEGIAGQVWEELQADHETTGTMGAAIKGITQSVGLVIANILTLSTFDPATQTVTVAPIDGTEFADVIAAILGACGGVAVRTGNVVDYHRQDGTTVVLTVTVGTPTGTRTASTLTPAP